MVGGAPASVRGLKRSPMLCLPATRHTVLPGRKLPPARRRRPLLSPSCEMKKIGKSQKYIFQNHFFDDWMCLRRLFVTSKALHDTLLSFPGRLSPDYRIRGGTPPRDPINVVLNEKRAA